MLFLVVQNENLFDQDSMRLREKVVGQHFAIICQQTKRSEYNVSSKKFDIWCVCGRDK